MKHKLFVSALLGVSLILMGLISCSSGPKPAASTIEEPGVQTETPKTTADEKASESSDPSKLPPDQAAESALAEAVARAEKSRKQAFDLEAPTTFAEDWKKAEDFFLMGREKAQVKTQLSYSEAITAYTKATDAYDELALKALPLYAEARRQEMAKARADAVKAGADQLLPEQLAVADKVADKAKTQYEGGDYYTAAAAAQEARTRYLILKTGLEAYSVQEEIDRRDFAKYDAGNYSLAEQKLQASHQAYDAGDISPAQNNAEEALLRFRLVLNKGREMNASSRSQAAQAERQAAQDLKANVAVKSDFERAQAVFADAEQAFKAEKYDEAADLYAEAETLFADVKTVAAEKRAQALEAMQAAQQKITATEDAAKKADTVLEGGSR
ncbi:hypothetical protein [Gracilinema caldarium]|uniref:Treponemal membrane protein A n=1 Tax=Gracilinema caldarium (strain ATCC 51460 / DSM 7334 / H1) TaxID=744872 RepID=F8EYM1_GRAC1|nr:hypothetical protein [Gracilinema caldarium]AEJ18598.1 hypothetical protein Spica_0434 [Gracilinema caldarium DSM 7334]